MSRCITLLSCPNSHESQSRIWRGRDDRFTRLLNNAAVFLNPRLLWDGRAGGAGRTLGSMTHWY